MGISSIIDSYNRHMFAAYPPGIGGNSQINKSIILGAGGGGPS